MSIEIIIRADNAADARREMELLLNKGVNVLAAPVTEPVEEKPVEEKPAPKSRGKAKPTETEKPSPEKEPEVSDEDATSSKEPSSAAVEGAIDYGDKDQVRAFLNTAIDTLGGQIVTEVFAEFGAASFKGIGPDKYEALCVRLEELIANKE